MKLTEITLGVARTINLGNYESLRLEASASASLEDGEDVESVRAKLAEHLRHCLSKNYGEFKDNKGQRA